MGGEGSISAMITSLRNNANMRLKRNHFFKKQERLAVDKIEPQKMRHVKRSPEQISQFNKKLKIQKRKENIRMIIALIIAAGILITIAYFVLEWSPQNIG